MLPALAMMFAANAGQSLLGGLAEREQIKQQNKLIKQQNRTNTMETLYSVSLLDIQAAQSRMQAAQDLSTAGRMAKAATGDVVAQAAAAGVKGASVDAAAADIDRELGEAEASIERAAIDQAFNTNEQQRSMLAQTRANLGRLADVPSFGNILLRSAISGASQAGQAYASNYFQFGSSGGSKTATIKR
jgi:hypothetical protein